MDTTGMDDRGKAGLFLLLGGTLFLLGLQVAEALYVGYDVHDEAVSDLGVGPGPSALIFNVAVALFGLFGVAAAYLLWRDGVDRGLPIMLALSGLGAIGVGVLTEDAGGLHVAVSFLAFFFGALFVLWSYRLVGLPLGYLSAVLGTISLAALALYAASIYLDLGHGGMERMILYPILAWIIALGAGLAGRPRENERTITGPVR